MASSFTFSISNDFPQHVLSLDRLSREIRASAITVAFDAINTVGDVCVIAFKSDLSLAEEGVLQGLVAAHSGEPLPPTATPVSLDSPKDYKGKPFFAPDIYPKGNYRNITGRADDTSKSPDEGRGAGAKFMLNTDSDDAVLEFGFVDPVWIGGGSIIPYGADYGDTCSMQIFAPASTVTPALGGDGNCNVVDPGIGAPIMIVPANGNGQFNVDLTTAVPIPYGDDWLDTSPGGCFWNWTDGGSDPPLTGPGVITPNYTQGGSFNLFVIDILLVTHAREVPLQGESSQQTLTLAAIQPKLILPQWKFKVTLHNEAKHAGLRLAWYLDLGRAKT